MLLPVYLGLLASSERALGESFREVARGHADEPDVFHLCHTLGGQCDAHLDRVAPVIARYGERRDDEPDRLHADALAAAREGPLGLLRDLGDLYVLASLVDITWTAVRQASAALRDVELNAVVAACDGETKVQLAWISTRLAQAAPQALVAAS